MSPLYDDDAMERPAADRLEDYDVVGATLVAQAGELPLRLRPILRSRHDDARYALLVDDGDGELDGPVAPEETAWSLQPEDADFIRAGAEQGRFHLFPLPLSKARAGHWLVQLEPRVLPAYLPAEQAHRRLQEEGERALRAGAEALASGAHQDAIIRAAYASRALPHDPLPRLALLALSRPRLTDSQLWLKARPLRAFATEKIQERFAQAKGDQALAALIRCIISDPLADEYELTPPWIPKAPAGKYLRRQAPGARWGRIDTKAA